MTAEATVLVEENHNLIYGYLHRMRLSIEEYYDLAAIGLCKAANSFDVSAGYKFSTYAYKCMNNEVLRQMQKENRHITPLLILDDDKAPLHLFLSSQITIEDTIVITWLREIITDLPPQKQEIVRLTLMGLNQREIAERLHVSQASVSRLLGIVRNKLTEESF